MIRSLVGHGGGADLSGLERLVHLLQVGKQTDVSGEFHGALRNAGEHGEYIVIRLAGIGLAADGVGGGEPELFRDLPFERLDLFAVAAEQLQKARTGAGRASAAKQLQVGQHKIQMLQIHHQILHPQGGALAECGRLSRLKMGIGQGGEGPVRLAEIRQRRHRVQQQGADAQQRVPLLQHVGVVTDIAAGGTEMDDGLCLGAGHAVGVNVRHDIVAHLPLPPVGQLKINVVRMRLHLGNLLVGNIEPELLLAFGQNDPQTPPRGEFTLIGKNLLHFPAGIAPAEGVDIGIVHTDIPHLSDNLAQ